MTYPFHNNATGHPILDTEEKLQWYMNRLLHREVNLSDVCASVVDLETVLLEPRPNEYAQQIAMLRYAGGPTLREPRNYGRVDRAVVTVLREIHSRRDAEMEQRRREEAIEDYKERQQLMVEAMTTEKESTADYISWWKSLFQNGKENNK